MTTMAAPEQLLLEMINRARLDPAGEAARLGIDLNEGLAAGTISLDPKQPLAGNNLLAQAAEGHSNVMLSSKVLEDAPGPNLAEPPHSGRRRNARPAYRSPGLQPEPASVLAG